MKIQSRKKFDILKIENNNRKKLINLIHQIPKEAPMGWESHTIAVGGLMYVGFSEAHTEKLICISSQGQSVIDCQTLKKVYCDENFDENDLLACAEELGDEMVRIAGEGGGGLRHYSKDGSILQKISPHWPKEQIIFMPDFCSWHITPERCRMIFEDYEIKTYGFSKCGNYFVIATSSDLIIYRKKIIVAKEEKI